MLCTSITLRAYVCDFLTDESMFVCALCVYACVHVLYVRMFLSMECVGKVCPARCVMYVCPYVCVYVSYAMYVCVCVCNGFYARYVAYVWYVCGWYVCVVYVCIHCCMLVGMYARQCFMRV